MSSNNENMDIFNSGDIINILQNSKIGMWRLDMVDGIPVRLYTDILMNNLMGIDNNQSPEVTLETLLNRIHPDDRKIFAEYDKKLIEKEHAEIMYRYIHPQRGIIYVRCSGQFQEEIGSVAIFKGYHQDVTDTIRVERESNEKNERIIAELGTEYEAVHFVDLDNNSIRTIRFSDNSFTDIDMTVEQPFDKLAQMLARHYVVPEMYDDMLDFIKVENLIRKIEKENCFFFRYRSKRKSPGYNVYELKFIVPKDYEKRNCLIIGAKCINEMLDHERKHNLISRALLNDCAYFYEFDVTDGYIKEGMHVTRDFNPMFGLKIDFPIHYDDYNDIRSKRLGLNADSSKEASYWTCEGLKAAYAKGKRSLEIRYESEQLMLSFTATIILIEDKFNQHIHAVYICRDVTEIKESEKRHRKELEKALAQANKANEAKSQFLFNMSHDIRTPMNAIIGYTNLIERKIDNKNKVLEYINKMHNSCNVLLSLINNVLEMAKIESGMLTSSEEICDYKEFNYGIIAVFENVLNEKNIIFSNEINIIHEQFICDVVKLREIFLNILSNAVKYTPKGGHISIVTEEIYNSEDNSSIIKSVISDDGIGMSEEYLPHIFDEFEREHNSTDSGINGSGLGMSIVKKIMDILKGTIRVESKSGCGTRFYLEIPVKIPSNNSDINMDIYISEVNGDAEVSKNFDTLAGKRILLAEDNDMNAEIVTTILKEYSLTIERAENGKVCVDMLSQVPDRYYDLVLMDIQMPVMNGFQATEEIRRMKNLNKAFIPIIALTANAFEEDKRNSLNAGMNGHLAKPIIVKDLIDTLNRWIGRSK